MNKIRNVSLSFLSVALIFLATSLSLKAADEYTLNGFGFNLFNVNKKKIGSLRYGPDQVVQESDFPITAALAHICPTLESNPRCTSDDKVRVVIQKKGCYNILYYPQMGPPYDKPYVTQQVCGKKPKGSAQRSAQQPKNKR